MKSWELMEEMRKHSHASGLAKTVGVAVASYAYKDAIAFPGNDELLRWGFGERTIQRGLRKLEELGDLSRRRDLETKLRPRVYEVHPAGGAQLSLLDGARTGVTQTPVSLTPVTQTAGGVCLAPAREGTGSESINVNGTPLKPPQGGASVDQDSDPAGLTPRPAPRPERATASRRRRERRRRPGWAAPGAPAADCPLSGLAASDGAAEDLLGAWRAFLERLRGESWWERFELWFDSAHPHPDPNVLTIGLEPDRIERLERPGVLDAMHRAAGRPVALAPCAGAPTWLSEAAHA